MLGGQRAALAHSHIQTPVNLIGKIVICMYDRIDCDAHETVVGTLCGEFLASSKAPVSQHIPGTLFDLDVEENDEGFYHFQHLMRHPICLIHQFFSEAVWEG